MKSSLLVASLLAVASVQACGRQEATPVSQPTEADRLREEILNLQGTVSQISSLVLSDWATCTAGGADGMTTFQRNICRIAQAATAEQALKWRGVLSDFADQTEKELQDLQDRMDGVEAAGDVAQIKTDLYGTGTSCATATAGSICVRTSTLETTVANHTTQINTLISDVATINSQLSAVINGAMLEITVGQENLAAGPLYEAVLRNPARTRLTAYVESIDANKVVSNNGVNTTNGSPTVVVTSTAHGYAVGNVVKLGFLTRTGGLASSVLNDQYVITAVTANTFSFTAPVSATSNSNGGGNSGYVYRVNGRGLGMAWQAADGEQLLTTTFSNKPYKFLMTAASTVFTVNPGGTLPVGWGTPASPGTGFLCYSISNRSATAAQVKAGGSDIRCY